VIISSVIYLFGRWSDIFSSMGNWRINPANPFTPHQSKRWCGVFYCQQWELVAKVIIPTLAGYALDAYQRTVGTQPRP
jgi:hypothetical protein